MTATTLLDTLTQRGVEFELHGDKLRFRPMEAISPDEVDLIRQHKTEIMEMLSAKAAPSRPIVEGTEHFSIYIWDEDAEWPEFQLGVHYDITQPSTLRGLCTPPATPIQPDRLRHLLTVCDRCCKVFLLE
jgi:hypothetical protein